MRNLALIAILSFGLSSPVMAQAVSRDGRFKPIHGKELRESDCASHIAKAASATGETLIYGAGVCKAVQKPVESSFLFLIGQLRAASDIMLLPPATQAEDQGLMGLYTTLYYGQGVNGADDEVLRNPATRARLFKLLDEWSPDYGPDYNPGWTARKRPDAAKYAATIAEGKAGQRQYLDMVVRMVSDDEYYALHGQYLEVMKRNPDSISPNTADGTLFDDLVRRKRDRAIALGIDVGPAPPDPRDVDDPVAKEKADAEMLRNFAPASREDGEKVISGNADPIAEKCTDHAERTAVSRGGRIVGMLITSSPKWGTILRADIAGGDADIERFTCTDRSTSSRPRDEVPPLPGHKVPAVQ
jgi:hypothetical protein